VLRKDSKGPAVEQLQHRLHALKFYNGTIDGVFGQGTEDAVKAFQTQYNLEVDGIVGGATWDLILNPP
jgi:peptidoglycan hydrolase-like protein with peptidoglycan-binding domain